MNRPNDQRGFVHKRILGAVSGFASSVLSGGNPILGVASGFARGGGQGGGLPAGSRVQIPTPGFAGRVQRFLPGGGTGFTTLPPGLIPKGPGGLIGALPGVPGGASGFADPQTNGRCPTTACPPAVGNRRVNAAGECAPPGYHWNVSGYFRKGGPCSKFEAGFVECGTVLVKNRKMNNANGGAQDKALKRIERGQDHAKRILKATGWRTISKQSSRELRMRKRTGHR